MKKIKILRIITRLNIGGPAQHVLLLTRLMQDESFETKLIIGSCDKSEGDMMYLAEKMNIKPIVIKEMSREINILKDLVALFRIYKIIKKEKPDIIHTHTAKAGALGRLASMFAGRSIRVHTFHGHSLEGYFSKGKSAFFSSVEKILARFTHRIIAISNSQINALSGKHRIAKRDKFSVIDLGLNLEGFLTIGQTGENRLRKNIGISKKAVLIGTVGRLVEIKNHRMLLDVIKKIESISRTRDYKFIIVGDGNLKKDLIDYTKKLGIADLVQFTGWHKDIRHVFEGLDIVALTSLNEGTPASLIQALASSRPVISTDVGGVRSVVMDGKNGYLVRPNDVNNFSEKILDLASNPEKRKDFGMFGRKYIKNRFSGRRLVNDLERLYLELIKKTERN